MKQTLPRLYLLIVLVFYLAASILYARAVPKWNAPDEPAHFNYIRQIATTGTLPVLRVGDYDFKAVEERMAQKFPDSLPIDWMRYESHQPPLYYLLATPVYLLFAGGGIESLVLALRLFSTLLGATGLVLIYLIVRRLVPDWPLLAPTVAGAVAFIPQRVAMYSAIENDALAEVVVSAVLLVLLGLLLERPIRGHQSRDGSEVLLGVLLGLALLTKVVAYVTLPLAALALIAHAYFFRDDLGTLLRSAFRVFGIAFLLSAAWFVRNAMIYGLDDPFGFKRHDQVVLGQPLTGALAGDTIQRFVTISFHSFWGQFGWMGILMDNRLYLALFILTLISLVGLLIGLVRIALTALVDDERSIAFGLIALTVLFVSVGVLYYNLSYLQAQGRYYFPALSGIGLFFVLGLSEPLRLVHLRPLIYLLPPALFGLTILCLNQFIIPSFAGG